MSKRSGDDQSAGSNAKRSKGGGPPPPLLQHLALKGAWDEAINNADLESSEALVSEMENILLKAREKRDKLKKEDEDRRMKAGLSYKGADAITCDCGSTCKPGRSSYHDICGGLCGSEKEQCIECLTGCVECSNTNFCTECGIHCANCEEGPFCEDCLCKCDSCEEMFCGREERGCEMKTVGFHDFHSACSRCAN
jgi:hypothetical protein